MESSGALGAGAGELGGSATPGGRVGGKDQGRELTQTPILFTWMEGHVDL